MAKVSQTITLKGGSVVLVDWGAEAKCRSCGRQIWWAKTKNDKNMPINACGAEFESHFASCPAANKFRKEAKKM